jgi:hypothetical protein
MDPEGASEIEVYLRSLRTFKMSTFLYRKPRLSLYLIFMIHKLGLSSLLYWIEGVIHAHYATI